MSNKNTKILVTGAAGFMGSHLVDLLTSKGFLVFGVDDLSGGFLHNVKNKKNFTELDLRDRVQTSKYIDKIKPNIIFHLAADATEGRSQFTPQSAIDRNLVAYINLLVPAIRNEVKKVILISSMSVYGKQPAPFKESMAPRPEDIYGISKASMEEATKVLAQVYGFKFVIIRPHNVYGPRQNLSDPYRNVIGIFINRLLQGKNFYIYGNGQQKRAFSYIDDVTPAIYKAAFTIKAEGQIFNIGSGTPTTLKELSDLILKQFFNNKIEKKFKPTHLPDRPQEVKYAYSDHTKARKILGFEAKTNLEEGLKEMIKWARSIGPQKFKYLEELEINHPKVPKTWKSRLI